MAKWWIIAAAAVLAVGGGLAALVLTGTWPGPSEADRERSRELFAQAQTQMQSGDQQAALASLDQSIDLDVQNDALRLRVSIYMAQRNFDAALRDLDTVISRRGGLAENYSERCWLRARGDNLEGARADCDRALEISPALASAFGARGLVGLRQGRHREAWDDFNAALRVGGSDEYVAWRAFGRGVAAYERGDTLAGREDIERALRSNPTVAAEYAELGLGREILAEFDDAAYAAAVEDRSLIAFQQYLYIYPDGAHVTEARAKVDEIYAWIAEDQAAGRRALPGFSFAQVRGNGPAHDSFGAIGISRSTWRVAFSTDYATPQEAMQAAAGACNSASVRDCDAYAFRNVCAALAISPSDRRRGMAWAYGQDEAVRGAMMDCRQRGGRACVAVHSQCTPTRTETTPAPEAQ